jgi:hypothetical protein
VKLGDAERVELIGGPRDGEITGVVDKKPFLELAPPEKATPSPFIDVAAQSVTGTHEQRHHKYIRQAKKAGDEVVRYVHESLVNRVQ